MIPSQHRPLTSSRPTLQNHHTTAAAVRIPFGARGFLLASVILASVISFLVSWSFHHAQSTIPSSSTTGQQKPLVLGIPTTTKTKTGTTLFDFRPNINITDEEDDSVVFHFIVSSECSSYQLWETLTSFHAAEAVHQCGRFTWIISGCLPNDQLHQGIGKSGANSDLLTPQVIQQHVDRHFPPHVEIPADCSRLRPALHFTPDYSDMSVYGGPYADGKTTRYFVKKDGSKQRSTFGNRYVFNNKPNGLLHWAEANNDDSIDDVIVLIDPDFLFLTKFHLARPDVTVMGRKDAIRYDRDVVFPGQPAAASYGLGAQWLDFDLVKICGPDSHCANTTRSDVHNHFSAGPPYIIHRKDVLPLAKKWASLVPGTYDEYPLLYAEMYAYSMAAAHLQLRHNLVNNLFTGCMVGWPNPDRWSKNGDKSMEAIERAAVRESADSYRTSLGRDLAVVVAVQEKGDNNIVGERFDELYKSGPGSCFQGSLYPPPMLHYCQRYFIKATREMRDLHANVTYRFFAKRRMDHKAVLACDNDEDTGDSKNSIRGLFVPFASEKEYEKMAGGNVDWNTLAVCAITRALNFAKLTGCSM
ncbi:hypothetical protein IV203_000511 [Nitzschia inconspicua]|uniref:Uncharacterized protein n=1 Tax=Nitzschia inconspicua TaxID=303405 RepID=A0A9K3PQ16_9STRA|nr:hypothetical protein IV203_000511 [Nitzschia inconspicua]